MTKGNVISFVLGLVVGGGTATVVTYKFCMNKISEEIDRRLSEADYNDVIPPEYRRTERDEEDEPEIETNAVNPVTPDIQEKLKRNYEQTTNYASMYKKKDTYTAHKLAENEHPEEDYAEETDEQYEQDETHFDEVQQTKYKKPRIISAEEYGNLEPGVDASVVDYFVEDDILADDIGDVLPQEQMLGDSLTKFNFKNNDEDVIFVRNYEQDTVYEVVKQRMAYSDKYGD